MKPDVMNAAWKAFWSVAQSGPPGAQAPPPPVAGAPQSLLAPGSQVPPPYRVSSNRPLWR